MLYSHDHDYLYKHIIMKTTQFLEKYTTHFIERVRKGLLKVLLWEGVGDQTEQQHIDPHSYGHQRCIFRVLQGCSTGGLWALRWVLFSLPHLDSNSSDLQLTQTSCAELYYCFTPTQSILMASQAGICHFRCLWSGMFDHHQTEITVMQFRGHPLPVHQFLTVLWDFNPVNQPSSPTQSLVRVGGQYTTLRGRKTEFNLA